MDDRDIDVQDNVQDNEHSDIESDNETTEDIPEKEYWKRGSMPVYDEEVCTPIFWFLSHPPDYKDSYNIFIRAHLQAWRRTFFRSSPPMTIGELFLLLVMALITFPLIVILTLLCFFSILLSIAC